MIYTIIAACIIVGLFGVKKPIYGGVAGLVVAPFLHYILFNFDQFIFNLLFPIGFVIGLFIGSIVNKLFFFVIGDHDDQNTRPYYRSMHHGTGGGWGGGIVYTDEEEKNAKQNEDGIR